MTWSSIVARGREIVDLLIAAGGAPSKVDFDLARSALTEASATLSQLRTPQPDEFVARYECNLYLRLLSSGTEPDYGTIWYEAQHRDERDRLRHALLSLAYAVGGAFPYQAYLRVVDIHLDQPRMPRLAEIDDLMSRYAPDCRRISMHDWHPILGRNAFWELTQLRNSIARAEDSAPAWYDLISSRLSFLVVQQLK